MRQELEKSKENALHIVKEYRNELLKEFLIKKQEVCNQIMLLSYEGIDNERHIRFEDVEAADDSFTVLKRDYVLWLKVALQGITNDDMAIEQFRKIVEEYNTKDYVYAELAYTELREMEELEYLYMKAKHAQDMIA